MYHDFFIHSSVDGHLGCFHVLTIVNSAAMNNGIHVSFSILVSSGYRQRFITTIKNVRGKKKLKSLIRFHRANKMDNRGGGWRGRKDKIQKKLQNKPKHKNTKCFCLFVCLFVLSHCCHSSFPCWESQSTSPP